MTSIAWYLAIGTVLTLTIISLLHEMTKKYSSLEIVVICIVDILLWPVLLFKMIRPTYDLIINLIALTFDYFHGKFRGNF